MNDNQSLQQDNGITIVNKSFECAATEMPEENKEIVEMLNFANWIPLLSLTSHNCLRVLYFELSIPEMKRNIYSFKPF